MLIENNKLDYHITHISKKRGFLKNILLVELYGIMKYSREKVKLEYNINISKFNKIIKKHEKFFEKDSLYTASKDIILNMINGSYKEDREFSDIYTLFNIFNEKFPGIIKTNTLFGK